MFPLMSAFTGANVVDPSVSKNGRRAEDASRKSCDGTKCVVASGAAWLNFVGATEKSVWSPGARAASSLSAG